MFEFVVAEQFHVIGISRLGQNLKPRNCFSSAPFNISFIAWDGTPPLSQTPDNYYAIVQKRPSGFFFRFHGNTALVLCQE